MGHDAQTISAIADRSSAFHRGRAASAKNWHFVGMSDDAWRKRLEEVIERDGRSLRDISLAAGLSHGYLHGILRDDKEPTLDRFLRICKELNISVAYALLGAQLSAESEELVKLLQDHPEKRAAILALLPRD